MIERRVGTFTLGLSLLIFGIMFLLQLVVKNLDYVMIFRFWPLVLIFLGIEVLVSLKKQEAVKFRYDVSAIFILILLVVFTMGMAGADWVISNIPMYY